MKKRILALAIAAMTTLGGTAQAFDIVNLPKTMTMAEALEIYDVDDIINATVTDIEDGKCITLTSDEIKDFYYSAQGVELTRRINPTPFRGIAVNLYTASGEVKTFNLSSGVQLGAYGKKNYVCYAMDEANAMDYMYLDSLYHESDNKREAEVVAPNTGHDFLKLPQDPWAVDSIKEAASRSLVPYELTSNYGAYISREQYCILLGNFIAVTGGYATIEDYMKYNNLYYDDGAFADCVGRDKSICILYALGVVNGKGNAAFEPDACLTREEAAKLATETASLFRYIETYYDAKYADSKQISQWADFYVNWVTEQGIMSGVDATHFAPKDYYTQQQAIATVTRLYNVCH